jgi:hypothetical protein
MSFPRLSAPLALALLAPALLTPLALLAALPARAEKPRKPAPPLPARQYDMRDTHDLEHVTIAALPADTPANTPDFRLPYLRSFLMPIRVIVSNDSDQSLSLDDARINLIADGNVTIPAATNDDLQRRLFTLRSTKPTRIPLPLPIPVTIPKKPVDTKILADTADFGFKSTTIAPHATAAGYLFYDMQGVDQPFLHHATLELRKVRYASTNKPLDTFDINLHPTSEPTSPTP